jgi:hypothetical protein
LNPLGTARREKHVRSAALEHASKHGSLRYDGIEDDAKVRDARLEVRWRNVPA